MFHSAAGVYRLEMRRQKEGGQSLSFYVSEMLSPRLLITKCMTSGESRNVWANEFSGISNAMR
jgi:hypothetical protein